MNQKRIYDSIIEKNTEMTESFYFEKHFFVYRKNFSNSKIFIVWQAHKLDEYFCKKISKLCAKITLWNSDPTEQRFMCQFIWACTWKLKKNYMHSLSNYLSLRIEIFSEIWMTFSCLTLIRERRSIRCTHKLKFGIKIQGSLVRIIQIDISISMKKRNDKN